MEIILKNKINPAYLISAGMAVWEHQHQFMQQS